MYVSSTVSWIAHIVVFLCVIRWSGSYANPQNLREKNDTSKLLPTDRRHVVSSTSVSQPILEKHQLPKLEIGEARHKNGISGKTGNGSLTTVGHKREKRCLFALMAAGAVASAASLFMPRRRPPPPPPPPPPRIVWVPPKPVWRPPPQPVWRPPPKPVWHPPPKPVWHPPPRPQWRPPPKPQWRPPPPKPKPKPPPPKPKPKPPPPKPKPPPPKPKTTTPKPAKLLKPTNSCETAFGRCVVQGNPHYSAATATIVMTVVQRIVNNVWVLEFVHPVTQDKICIPRDVGDEYIILETQQVFTIFVDRQNRTYFIYEGPAKGSSPPKGKPEPDKTIYVVTNINTNINIIVNYNKVLSAMCDKRVGRLVIGGVPEFSVIKAVFIMKVTKLIVNGIWVIEFVHPPTGQKVQVPADVGDEYVIDKTRQIFQIFVDINGRTYMIFKGTDKKVKPPAGAPSIDGFPKPNVTSALRIDITVQKIVAGVLVIEFAHPKTYEIIQVPFNVGDVFVELRTGKVYLEYVDRYGITFLILKGILKSGPASSAGRVVVNGKPAYNLKNPTKVTDTRQKTGLDGKPVIEFVHPFTKLIIQIPVDVGQVHVDEATRKVYVIYVDVQGRTLLIFKGLKNKGDGIMTETIVGTIVVNGNPKYDIKKAIIVIETTRKVRADGTTVIEFRHPTTQQLAQIPANVGDEHFDPSTKRIFTIVVDNAGMTLLIFKGWKNRKDPPTMSNAGSVVIKGVPAYDIATAIIIRDTVRMVGVDGRIVIEFVYPGARQKIRIPLDVGDDYTKKETGELFKIFVDVFGRTYLIFKGKVKAPQDPLHGVRIVIGGIPKYNTSTAIFVENSEKMLNANGSVVIVFTHSTSGKRVELPYDVGDVYVKPGTARVYKIVVDSAGKTLLVFRGHKHEDKLEWVIVVRNQLPIHDISKAIYVMQRKIFLERDRIYLKQIVEFEHPITRVVIRIVYNGGDRYIKPGTNQSFLIVVDNRDRTLLIFLGKAPEKGSPSSPAGVDEPSDDIDNDFGDNDNTNTNTNVNINTNINTNTNVNTNIVSGTHGPDRPDNSKRPLWGSIVVGGKPRYDIATAIYITKTEKKKDSNGDWVIVFVHPDTKETIQVPFKGSDEYVERATGRVFIIVVDRRGKTILIFKGYSKDLDSPKGTSTVKPMGTSWGTRVVGGKPRYDIATAIYVTQTEKKKDSNGDWVIVFVHPDTKETIEVPVKGTDEYVERSTGRVFIIIVDRRGKTILVLKGDAFSNAAADTNVTSSVTVVVNGKPRYDIATAIYVTQTEKKKDSNGRWVIEFVHPDTKETIQVPFKGSDEYVERATGRVFIIVVDRRMKTILIYKESNGTGSKTSWGSMVIDGKPNYDIATAIYVTQTEKKKDSNGRWVIEFVHPDTKETIQVPFKGGDEYVERATGRVFIIIVDRRMKTILVYKESNGTGSKTSWGSMVIDGKPNYDIATAIYVTQTEKKKDSNGRWVIEFVHPDTKETIQVPFKGGDEYVERATGRVFIIIVDRQMKTILVYKESNGTGSKTSWGSMVIDGKPNYDIATAIYVTQTEKKKDSNGRWVIEFVHPDTKETIQVPFKGGDEYVERATGRIFIIVVDRRMKTILVYKESNGTGSKTSWGSMVIDGKPNYDIATAIYVTQTEKKKDSNGRWVIEFVHPDTKETIQVPFKGGDEYVERATGRIFIIVVDRRMKTILVFKGREALKPTKKPPTVDSGESDEDDSSTNNENENYNVNTNINKILRLK